MWLTLLILRVWLIILSAGTVLVTLMNYVKFLALKSVTKTWEQISRLTILVIQGYAA